MSVGIDQNAYLASGSNGAGQVYGPATALYVTYSAMWQDQLKRPNLRSGEMDSEEVELWLAAQQVLCVSCMLECVCFVWENACTCVCVCVCVCVCTWERTSLSSIIVNVLFVLSTRVFEYKSVCPILFVGVIPYLPVYISLRHTHTCINSKGLRSRPFICLVPRLFRA